MKWLREHQRSVSIHVPTRGTTIRGFRLGDHLLFQSTFPRGERLRKPSRCPGFLRFQSTFPRGERRIQPRSGSDECSFQSTFPRGERPADQWIFRRPAYVSIHVPTRGTTVYQRQTTVFCTRFQSTFPRGERRYSLILSSRGTQFQSTFPRGERRRAMRRTLATRSFNPRSHEGNDDGKSVTAYNYDWFQSTFPRGERQFAPIPDRPGYWVSIHVPTRGTTTTTDTITTIIRFQSTFPRGERPGEDRLHHPIYEVSIHVPTRGTTWS